MKIVSVNISAVNIPMTVPIRWAWGVRSGVTRTVIQIETDDGLVGLGETMGGQAIRDLCRQLGTRLPGRDPFDLEPILADWQLAGYFQGYAALAAIGGLEMALWDLKGKAVDLPLSKLLGGKVRDRVEISAYVFQTYESERFPAVETAQEVVDFCLDWRERAGFRTWKFKAGVMSPEHDLEVLAAMREALGPEAALRVDPNGVWTPQTTLRMRPALEELDLEYLEDPTWGLESMARLRREIPIPMATNMFVVEFDQIPLNVRLGGVDIILGDVHKWGGILAVKRLAGICETFGFGLSLHSGCELGISLAANVHLAATTPALRYAIDSHGLYQDGDIVAVDGLDYVDGAVSVPDGPGLGVSLEPDLFAECVERHRVEGDCPSQGDIRRPDFVPARQAW